MTVKSPTKSPTCVHHWLIEEANGPTSNGRCKKCGAERTFPNWRPNDKLRDDNSKGGTI